MLQHLDDLMVFSCFKGEAEMNEEESSSFRGYPGVVADSAQERPLHYQYPFFPLQFSTRMQCWCHLRKADVLGGWWSPQIINITCTAT